jgi:hypothetical protein
VAILHNGIGVRDSKDPDPILTVDPSVWSAFTNSVKTGRFQRS